MKTLKEIIEGLIEHIQFLQSKNILNEDEICELSTLINEYYMYYSDTL